MILTKDQIKSLKPGDKIWTYLAPDESQDYGEWMLNGCLVREYAVSPCGVMVGSYDENGKFDYDTNSYISTYNLGFAATTEKEALEARLEVIKEQRDSLNSEILQIEEKLHAQV